MPLYMSLAFIFYKWYFLFWDIFTRCWNYPSHFYENRLYFSLSPFNCSSISTVCHAIRSSSPVARSVVAVLPRLYLSVYAFLRSSCSSLRFFITIKIMLQKLTLFFLTGTTFEQVFIDFSRPIGSLRFGKNKLASSLKSSYIFTSGILLPSHLNGCFN